MIVTLSTARRPQELLQATLLDAEEPDVTASLTATIATTTPKTTSPPVATRIVGSLV